MSRRVAFLRAINVGGRRVKMPQLVALFEEAGFEEVETYIASGNVIFAAGGKAAELEKKIEESLGSGLGFEVPTFVRSRSQLAEILDCKPFGKEPTGHTHLVTMLRSKPSATARRAVAELSGGVDQLVVEGRELHWLIAGNQMDSEVKQAHVQKALGGEPGTGRKTTMLAKLLKKLE